MNENHISPHVHVLKYRIPIKIKNKSYDASHSYSSHTQTTTHISSKSEELFWVMDKGEKLTHSNFVGCMNLNNDYKVIEQTVEEN